LKCEILLLGAGACSGVLDPEGIRGVQETQWGDERGRCEAASPPSALQSKVWNVTVESAAHAFRKVGTRILLGSSRGSNWPRKALILSSTSSQISPLPLRASRLHCSSPHRTLPHLLLPSTCDPLATNLSTMPRSWKALSAFVSKRFGKYRRGECCSCARRLWRCSPPPPPFTAFAHDHLHV
jgi:hypothetical protein